MTAAQEQPPALAIANLSHAYGARTALENVNLCVTPGKFTVLLGLNGAGKTTLMSLVTRLYAVQSGAIKIFGFDIMRQPMFALRRLGVVFQARTLDLELSLLQNLTYHAALHGIGASKAKSLSEEALARVNLLARKDDKARTLSGGLMRQVDILRALMHGPALLLLDEPTVGLDIQARAQILAQLRERVSNDGLSVLWTTHLIDEISSEDDIIILHQGKVLAKGRCDRIIQEYHVQTIGEAFAKITASSKESLSL